MFHNGCYLFGSDVFVLEKKYDGVSRELYKSDVCMERAIY